MERDRRRRLQELAVDSAQDPNVVVRSGGGSDNSIVLIHHLHELPDHERDGLDPLHLLLRAKQLSLQVLLLVLDVLFLNVDELELALESLLATVEVVIFVRWRGVVQSDGWDGRRRWATRR